jgi:hypothetical protein
MLRPVERDSTAGRSLHFSREVGCHYFWSERKGRTTRRRSQPNT